MGFIEQYIEKWGSLPDRTHKYTRADVIQKLIETQVWQMHACLEHDRAANRKKHVGNTRELQVNLGPVIAMMLDLPENVGDFINKSIRSAFLDQNKNSVMGIIEVVFLDLAKDGFSLPTDFRYLPTN